MTAHDIAARADNFVIGVIAAVAIGALLAHAQTKDAADDRAACAHVEQQAKAAAQPDTWARLERQGCAMVACDRIGK